MPLLLARASGAAHAANEETSDDEVERRRTGTVTCREDTLEGEEENENEEEENWVSGHAPRSPITQSSPLSPTGALSSTEEAALRPLAPFSCPEGGSALVHALAHLIATATEAAAAARPAPQAGAGGISSVHNLGGPVGFSALAPSAGAELLAGVPRGESEAAAKERLGAAHAHALHAATLAGGGQSTTQSSSSFYPSLDALDALMPVPLDQPDTAAATPALALPPPSPLAAPAAVATVQLAGRLLLALHSVSSSSSSSSSGRDSDDSSSRHSYSRSAGVGSSSSRRSRSSSSSPSSSGGGGSEKGRRRRARVSSAVASKVEAALGCAVSDLLTLLDASPLGDSGLEVTKETGHASGLSASKELMEKTRAFRSPSSSVLLLLLLLG